MMTGCESFSKARKSVLRVKILWVFRIVFKTLMWRDSDIANALQRYCVT